MNTRRSFCLAIPLVVLGTAGPGGASVKSEAGREGTEYVLRKFGKEVAKEGAATLSRKIENLEAAVNLHMAYFNFCWRPGTMKVTPAQAAGIADHCWTFDELLAG